MEFEKLVPAFAVKNSIVQHKLTRNPMRGFFYEEIFVCNWHMCQNLPEDLKEMYLNNWYTVYFLLNHY